MVIPLLSTNGDDLDFQTENTRDSIIRGALTKTTQCCHGGAEANDDPAQQERCKDPILLPWRCKNPGKKHDTNSPNPILLFDDKDKGDY